MSYKIKEIYYTLQGEGAHSGRSAVFCRFTGCNLWSGREEDRAEAVCNFCDTDFNGTDGENGGIYSSAGSLSNAITEKWPANTKTKPYVVCTGGEPLLQLDTALVEALHAKGFEIGIETNGTIIPPGNIDWICVSPKAGSKLVLTTGDELKLVYPQTGNAPEDFNGLDFRHFFLQPLDGPAREQNTHAAVHYCLQHPKWRLSLQTHKYLGIR